MQEIASPIPATHFAPPNRARFVVPALLFAALALAPLLGLLGAERYVLSLFTRCIVFAIAAVGLDLALGYGGLVSFGHAAFIGIGGYAAGILTASGIDDAFIGLFAALAASGLFALATGAISLKTRGVHFIMITLAFGQMAYFLANSLKAYGGDDGLTLPNRATLFGRDLLADNRVFDYVALAMLVGVYLFARAIVRSRFGRVLRGAKDNETRMAAIGFDAYPFRLAASDLGDDGGACGLSPRRAIRVREPRLHDLATVGRSHHHGHARRDGIARRRHSRSALRRAGGRGAGGMTEHWRVIFGPFLILVVLFARGGLLGMLRGRRAVDVLLTLDRVTKSFGAYASPTR